MKNLAVFASGQGTTFRHLLESQSKNLFSGNIKLLVTNKTGIGAVAIANEFNIAHQCIPSKSLTKNQDLLDALKKNSIDFIILTGYLAKIDKPIITEYKNKIINTHPSGRRVGSSSPMTKNHSVSPFWHLQQYLPADSSR